MSKKNWPAAFLVGIFCAAGVAFSIPAAAKLYKWVDDNGVTHYGETIPPEYADKSRSELNKQGRVIKQDEVLTPEERAAQEQKEAKQRADEQAARDQKRRDKALLDTYTSVAEIELARKRNVDQIDLRINSINANMKIAADNLAGLQKEAETYTSANKELPRSLQDELKETRSRVDRLQKDLEKSEAEKAATNARFDEEKARYKELTGK